MDWTNIDFEKLANAILILIVGIGGAFGINQARKKPPISPPTETLELAGAVISAKDAKLLVEAFERVTIVSRLLIEELVENRRTISRNTDSADNVAEATNHANNELRNLANALLLTRK